MKNKSRDKEISRRLRALVPLASFADFTAIESKAMAGHLRHLPASIAAWQALTTHIRHTQTEYDALLVEGYDAESARHFILDALNVKLTEWGCTQQVAQSTDQF